MEPEYRLLRCQTTGLLPPEKYLNPSKLVDDRTKLEVYIDPVFFFPIWGLFPSAKRRTKLKLGQHADLELPNILFHAGWVQNSQTNLENN